MIRDRAPYVSEIVAELNEPTGEIGFCRNIRNGGFYSWAEPSEIYIDALGTWLRCDGSHAGFALNGQRDYGARSRQNLRAAVDRWVLRRAHAATESDVLKTLNRVVQPADWDGTFTGALAEAMLAIVHLTPGLAK